VIDAGLCDPWQAPDEAQIAINWCCSGGAGTRLGFATPGELACVLGTYYRRGESVGHAREQAAGRIEAGPIRGRRRHASSQLCPVRGLARDSRIDIAPPRGCGAQPPSDPAVARPQTRRTSCSGFATDRECSSPSTKRVLWLLCVPDPARRRKHPIARVDMKAHRDPAITLVVRALFGQKRARGFGVKANRWRV